MAAERGDENDEENQRKVGDRYLVLDVLVDVERCSSLLHEQAESESAT